jgi:hypothetical protein
MYTRMYGDRGTFERILVGEVLGVVGMAGSFPRSGSLYVVYLTRTQSRTVLRFIIIIIF